MVEEKGQKTANLLYALFAATYIITRLIDMDTRTMNAMIAFSGILCFCYSFFCSHNRALMNKALILACLFSSLVFMSSLYNSNAGLDNILWVWGYMGVALLMISFRINYKLAFSIYFLASLYVLIQALSGVGYDDIMEEGSHNMMVTMLILFLCLAYLSIEKIEKQLPYIPIILTLVIGVWTTSRGGIITMACMFVLVFLYNFFVVKRKKITTLLKLGCVVFVVSLVLGTFLTDAIQGFFERVDEQHMESARYALWEEYLSAAFGDVGEFLFGVRMNILHKLPQYGNNPHNSFLMLHARLGILGFVLMICMIVGSFLKYLKRKKYFYLVIFLVAIIRAFSDWVAFLGAYDIIFWFFILHSMNGENLNERKK